MIAATGSGCGKTTITCALLKAIKNMNMTPKSYKCGPDYIDPMFHKSVLGIESQNLDLFFSDEDEVKEIFYGEDNSDVSLVEGVMGLYDGINSSSNDGSSYDLACKLDIPVILVVNAHGMGRSLLAVIKGFKAMDDEDRIKAVILNQISPMYYETISEQIENELNIKVIGYFPKLDNIKIESRYLGLKMPNEIDSLESDIQKAAATIAQTVDVIKLLEMATVDSGKLLDKQMQEHSDEKKSVRIGVARDEAFCFFYEENLKLLKRLGAELVVFSPIHDTKLPKDLHGLLLGGGYPEIYAKQLADNKTMLESIKHVIDSGMPSLAECGGFMYLHDSIKVDDEQFDMVGAVKGSCEKKDRLVRFGYLNIEEKDSQFFVAANKSVKGHEFHYYDSTNNGSDAISTKPTGSRSWDAAHIDENYWWGFAHLYYPSNLEFAKAFIEKCEKRRTNNG